MSYQYCLTHCTTLPIFITYSRICYYMHGCVMNYHRCLTIFLLGLALCGSVLGHSGAGHGVLVKRIAVGRVELYLLGVFLDS